jgi:putative thioredoxin
MATDVTEAEFQNAVIDRSSEVPVVVDFWAEWCGPCRALTPALERAAGEREGKVELVKVDVDGNPGLAQAYGVQGIPAVKAFKNGEVVDEFVGAQPAPVVENFMDRLVPSEVDALVSEGDEDSLRRALEMEPGRADAAVSLAHTLMDRGDYDEAGKVLEGVSGDFAAEGLSALVNLKRQDPDGPLGEAADALLKGDTEAGLRGLMTALEQADDGELRDRIRKAMVGVFTELGSDDPLTREYRRKLAAALY